MGKLKTQKEEPKTFSLNKSELDYVTAIKGTRDRRYEEDGRIMGAFLKYIASSRLGYAPETNLQFEIDFDSEDKKLKVTTIS